MTRACFRLLVSLAVLAAPDLPARAAEPIYPTGSRVGLVPPEGMVKSEAFNGFEDPQKNAAIVIATLPRTAFAQIEKTSSTEAMRKQGIKVEKREPMRLALVKAFLIVGRQVAEKMRLQ